MLIERDLILAIEPECYRRWLDEAKQWLAKADSSVMERAISPESAAKLAPGKKSIGDIAVINLTGFITQKPSFFSMLFGGTSTEFLASTVREAMAEPSIGAVVLNVDSPGGIVFGVPEAAAIMREARGSKPFVAIANPLAASAGYYLSAQADEVVMTPSAMVGSIGVKVTHVNEAEALKQAGLEVTEITYGRRKTEESSIGPLSEEARASIQTRVDYYGQLFENDVAKGRRVSVATVRAKYGEGAMFTAKDALAAGLVDRIATLEDVLGGLASGQRKIGVKAESDPLELRARAALAGVFLESEERE